ncbi:MAG TPA: HIT domain-containing protein [Candidatus Latescibacteria bacterium]|nr:HIT domain-containing protein [Candidatus Latescibacterota bacterium]HQK21693.1 HIT domain-containing protein [Candidatus Latescibacterota bacterium]HRS96013.1 HIT domain-containing protein [Candidatus Latescibacterota bacterium]
MERLWAPWRMKYILGEAGRSEGCVFCEAAHTTDDAAHLVVGRMSCTMTIMNLFPYTNGHMMVIPYRHVSGLSDLTSEERLEIMEGAATAVDVLRETFHCDGNNLGFNLGRPAGAGIDAHLHMHVVPRWNGDTNYMAVLDDTRVISEALEETYRRLRAAYRERGLAPA